MKRSYWFVLFEAFLVLGGLTTLPAQAQEVQVPLSPDSTVYTIDAELRQELGLFPGISGFDRAQLYQLSADRYELVIEYRLQGQRLRERCTLSTAEVEQLRQQVAQQLTASGARLGLEQPGRPELLVWSTALSAAEGGLVVGALDPSNESLVGGIPLLAGAAGFFVPFFLTQDRPVTEAAGTLTGFGGLQGYAHGAQLAVLAGGEDVDGQATAGLMAATGAVEAAMGYHLGATRGWSPGMAEMMAFNGVAGNLLGLGVGLTVSGDKDAARSIAGASLVGSVIGGAAGYNMGRTRAYTRGDARIYSQAGLLAVQLAVSTAIVGDLDDTRAVAGLLTGSGLAGLAAGTALVLDRDFSTYASNIITLGNYAGSLLGAGIATVVNGSSDAITITQALGAVAGFGITYSVFAPEAHQAALTSSRLPMQLRIMPLLTVAPESPIPTATGRHLQPGLSLHARF